MLDRSENIIAKAQGLLQSGALLPHRVIHISGLLADYRATKTAAAYDALYNAVHS